MSFKDKFTDFHLDVIKEIGNIGAGNAATSLSTLLNRKVEMHVPSVKLVDFDEVVELAGGAEEMVVSVALKIDGEAPGSIFFLLPPRQAEQFIKQIAGLPSYVLPMDSVDEFTSSVLQELGNILSGSYISALSDFTGLELYLSVPSLSTDMAGAILSYGLLELSQVSDQAIVVETALHDENHENLTGHFFLFPDPDSYDRIFKALGVPSDE
ncbi:chemotaxis protein CheC [Halobacillus rhizosphaerae]|uniref:chemotaxis protein CheC n=1 Tax=Halobacillus rhizosphaerae TaxID=3064889 RepID=UPI00398ABB66